MTNCVRVEKQVLTSAVEAKEEAGWVAAAEVEAQG